MRPFREKYPHQSKLQFLLSSELVEGVGVENSNEPCIVFLLWLGIVGRPRLQCRCLLQAMPSPSTSRTRVLVKAALGAFHIRERLVTLVVTHLERPVAREYETRLYSRNEVAIDFHQCVLSPSNIWGFRSNIFTLNPTTYYHLQQVCKKNWIDAHEIWCFFFSPFSWIFNHSWKAARRRVDIKLNIR